MAATPVKETGVGSPFTPQLSLYMCYTVWTTENWLKTIEQNILRDFKFRTVKQLLASQPDIVVFDKEQKRAAATDDAIPRDFFCKFVLTHIRICINDRLFMPQ